MKNAELETLFERFRTKRDVGALARVYDRTAPELYRIALHLAGDPGNAEELLQATFLAAMENAERFGPERRLVPWLLGILRNQAGLANRDRGRRPDAARLPRPAVAEPGAIAARLEFDEAVDGAIARLPEAYQPVLVLHAKHGLGPGEIAHALRRSPSTVRTQLARGRELLRGLLPAGFTLSALAVFSARGPAAVRSHVLRHAGDVPLATLATGAVLMKKIAFVGVAAAGTALAFWFSDGDALPEIDATPPAGTAVLTAAGMNRQGDVPEPLQASTGVLPARQAALAAGAAKAAPARPAWLLVRVVDDAGMPVPHIQIAWRPVPAAAAAAKGAELRASFFGARVPVLSNVPLTGRLFRSAARPTAVTGSTGSARYDGKAGERIAVALLRSSSTLPVAIPVAPVVQKLAAGTNSLTIRAPRKGRVRVRLTGPAPAKARLKVRLEAVRRTWSDHAVSFRLTKEEEGEGALPPGEYDVRCQVPASSTVAPRAQRVHVRPGRTAEVRVQLVHLTGVISGRVVDHAGNPLPQARIVATPPQRTGFPEKYERAAHDGRFATRGLPIDLITVEIKKGGYATQTLQLTPPHRDLYVQMVREDGTRPR